jgi:hypothetical protein
LQRLVADPCGQYVAQLWVLLQVKSEVEARAVDLGAPGDPACGTHSS